MLVRCLSGGLESFHVDPSPTDPFVQRDAFSGVAHGLLPGDQLRLQAAGEHVTARCVRSGAPHARFLRVQISCSKVVTGRPWGVRHTLKWMQVFGVSHRETLVTCPRGEALHNRWFGSLCPQPSKLAWLSLTPGSVCPPPAQNEKKDWDI